MATCRGCGQALTDVSGRGVHPDPKCDRKTAAGEWWMSEEELAALAAQYPPRTPAQEANPE